MKKLMLFAFATVFIVTLSGCGHREELPLNKVVADILCENGIENSKITYICDDDYIKFCDNDDEYIDKIVDKCKFDIDKKEIDAYSEIIASQEKKSDMSDDEFYDYCYKKGLADVKRYLLVGAHTNEIDFVGDDFKEFCTYAGYDSNDDENLLAKYNYLKNITIADYRNLRVNAMAYKFISENDNEITAEVYDTNNVYNINYSENDGYSISDDVQQQIINSVKNISFRLSRYGDNDNHLYNKAVVLRNDGTKLAVIMIDDVNGYVKLQKDDGEIVFAKFDSTDLDEILSVVAE